MTKQSAPVEPTEAEAIARIEAVAGTLTPPDFAQTVLIATVDHMAWYAEAKYERFGPWHLIWTERHGDHIEYDGDLCKVHVYGRPAVAPRVHRTGRRRPAREVRS